MAISPVGPYTQVRPYAAPRPAGNTAPTPQGGYGGYNGGYNGGYSAPTGGSQMPVGKMAAWAAGGFAAWRWVLPMIGRGVPGLVQLGVIGAGAWVGNKAYNAVTGSGAGLGGGEVGRYVAWAGGAYGAFRLGTGMMQSGRPSGLFLGALLAGGAFAGNWVYNKLTGRA